jgi:hypothetical protein
MSSYLTLNTLIYAVGGYYIFSMLRNLSALATTEYPPLLDASGAVKPLLFPLFSLAPRGLSVTVALHEDDPGSRPLELFTAHGLPFISASWDMELSVNLLHDENDAPRGISITCARDGAGDFARECTALAAAKRRADAARGVTRDGGDGDETRSTPASRARDALLGVAAGANSVVRKGLLPSLAAGLSRAFGLTPADDVGGGGGGGDDDDGGARTIFSSTSKRAARIARLLVDGRRVHFSGNVSWTPAVTASDADVDPAGAAAARDALAPPAGPSLLAQCAVWLGLSPKDAAETRVHTAAVLRAAASSAGDVPLAHQSLAVKLPLTEEMPFLPVRQRRFLWRDVLGPTHALVPRVLGVNVAHEEARNAALARVPVPAAGARVPHWIGQVDLRLIADASALSRDDLPPAISSVIRVVGWPQRAAGGGDARGVDPRRRAHMPTLTVNPVRPTRERALPLNSTARALPLRLTLGHMGIGTWRLMRAMDQSIDKQHAIGATERDTDDIIRMLSDTPSWLLTLTFAVSFVHLLFDVLALKSDVQFWAGAKSLRGISVRSLGIQCVSNVVITTFLAREGSSLLVTVPQGALAALDFWKITRASGLALTLRWRVVPWVTWDSALAASGTAGDVGRHDAEAVGTLLAILTPLLFGAAARSFFYDTHVSWFDWALGVAVAAVYGFGFALMTPQLWMNYRLKSVAHLPWNVLFYRFFNTIIDDLFAVIIKMPLMHRVSVFRDDVVFVIYMIQRRVYAVDRSRPAEGFEGPQGEEVEDPPTSFTPSQSGSAIDESRVSTPDESSAVSGESTPSFGESTPNSAD